jgi:hypothetical protein
MHFNSVERGSTAVLGPNSQANASVFQEKKTEGLILCSFFWIIVE